jgi:predicted nucleic acid-binding protein
MAVEALSDLPHGLELLIDANIFVYAFLESSPQCIQLLRRCAMEDVLGITTVDVVSDVCHRLMLVEAVATGAISKQSAQLLKRKSEVIPRLNRYWVLTQGIFELPILLIELDEPRLKFAQEMRMRHGLLTSDSLLLAAADEYGITALTTLDSDFDGISWLNVYKPTDVP